MKTLKFLRLVSGAGVAAAILAGCAAPQPPLDMLGAARPLHRNALRGGVQGSWMLAEAKSQDLLYIANLAGNSDYAGTVTVYTYPQGKLVGSLNGFSGPRGLCIDRSGNVYVTNFYGDNVIEYAHGGAKPIATLDDNGSPYGCDVDPTTGNLAVANWCDGPVGSCYSDGTILIYRKAKGKPEVLHDPNIPAAMTYCAYDVAGNLFVDSYGKFYDIGFAELFAGTKTFETLHVKLPKTAQFSGGLQWVGKQLAVGFGDGNVIGEYKVRGSVATRVHVTPLRGVAANYGTNQFLVQDTTLIAPIVDTVYGSVQFFRYPQGGKAVRSITDGVNNPWAAAISATKPRDRAQ